MSNRPKPWSPAPKETIWVDYASGQGVTSNGSAVKPKIGARRKSPNLTDMLDTAMSYGAEIIRFTGKIPEPQAGKVVEGGAGNRHWLYVQTPGWVPLGHHPDAPATGRFRNATTGHEVTVRLAAEWFGDVPLTAQQARMAWLELDRVLKGIDGRASAFYAPSRTGANLWALALPRDLDPTPLQPDIADELHLTSGQHHFEHLVAGPSASTHDDCVPLIDPKATPKLERFSYIDGRFMYAALGRELGVGPGIRLKRDAAYELMVGERGRYARARYEVRFQVPKDWDHVGILGVQHETASDGWYYPNRPGATGITWADAAEVAVALEHGWVIDPQQAVVFNSHTRTERGERAIRPLDTWRDQLIRAREKVIANPDYHPILKRAMTVALRAILIQAIGYFASRGSLETRVVESAMDVPPEFVRSAVRYGDVYVYKAPTERNAAAVREFYHPELAAQIWARGRARVLSAPTALGNGTGGALAVDPSTLIGINGDAIYTSELPTWALPTEHGGGDDGKVGKLRLEGVVASTVMTPDSLAARDRLRDRAKKAGPSPAWATSEGADDGA